MKTWIAYYTIIALMTGILMTSCGEKSKGDKTDLNELKDLKKGAKDTTEEIKNAVNKDWEAFKKASEIAIEKTEKEIKKLRDKISKTNKKERQKLTNKLDKLEQKNIILKDKLVVRTRKFKENRIEFNENTKEIEKAFEREFNNDMNALGDALKDLFKDNVN